MDSNFFRFKIVRKLAIASFAIVFSPILSKGQASSSVPEFTEKLKSVSKVGVFPKNAPDGLYNFSTTGSYRFFGTFTQMKDQYIAFDGDVPQYTKPRSLFIGDDSQLPNFSLNFSGRPAPNAFWNFDLFAFQFLEGNVNPTYGGQILEEQRPTIYNPMFTTTKPGQSMGLLLGISTNAGISTDYGNIGVTLGGTQWLSISDLTLAAFRGYNRFMLFERNPWDPVTANIEDRYNTFYSQGNINQDTRWGERAFNGFTVRANDLPGNLDLIAMVGKTELNGGFLALPNTSYGGKIGRAWNGFLNGNLSTYINTLNTRIFVDSMSTLEVQSNIVSGQIKYDYKQFGIDAEIGAGRYISPIHDLPWGEAINLKIRFPFVTEKIPAELQVYRVHPNVVNSNAIYWNTAVTEYTANDIPAGSVGSSAVLRPFASPIVPIGLMTNNRQGINLNLEHQIGDLKLSVANGIAEELEAITNLITFGHPVNQLTRSRFWRWDFPAGVGPYGRQSDIFRDTYETMRLTDDSLGTLLNTKKFNVLEVQGKYKTKLFHRDLYVNLLNRYSSVQKNLSFTTVFSEEAYLRHYSNELEMYYQLFNKLMLTTYFGYERVLGNYDTELALETGKPRDQQGTGIGFGFDIDLGRNAGLYLRHRFFAFEDRSFTKDQFRGQETLLEIKVAF